MKYPGDARAIYKKLRTIAKGGGVFTVIDCIRQFGSGKHYTDDWEHCLSKLVAKGELRKLRSGGWRLRRRK